MFWIGVIFAICLMVGVLSDAPLRQAIVLGAGLWAGFAHWGPDGWAWFVGIICLTGFILSPMLWAWFGGGFYVGKNGFKPPWN